MQFTKLHVFLFLGAFVAGCLLVYYSPVEHRTIFVYPTPRNTKRLQYKDSVGSCFGFTAKEVKCTDNAKSIPAQI
jgi:hypothetical protein